MRTVERGILRCAAWLVPAEERSDWLAEWTAELWYARNSGGGATLFALGAFRDAYWLRRNRPRTLHAAWLASPAVCLCLLAGFAASSFFLAIRTNAGRDLLIPWPYPEAQKLALVSYGNYSMRQPNVAFWRYQWFTANPPRQFAALAFYDPTFSRVSGVDVPLVRASGNLFDVLGLRVRTMAPSGRAALVLSERAWRKIFGRGPQAIGRTVTVAGRPAVVTDIVADALWRLPGRADAWLLDDDLPRSETGFVLGRLAPWASDQPNWHWRMPLFSRPSDHAVFECALLLHGTPPLAFGLVVVIALLLVRAITPLDLGEYPAHGNAPRSRRWLFLGAKIVFLLPIVFFGTLAVTGAEGPLLPQGVLAGCVVAFRWALMDQRRRCPVCLRVLTNPTRIGSSSQMFLEWYGTELICLRGHGMLHVPEIPSSSYATQRWHDLDPSWSGLFS